MSKQFNVNETAAGAGNSRAMEADTILKTRASLKSHKGRGNFLIKACFVLMTASIIFCGCGKDDEKDNGNGNGNGEEKTQLVKTITYHSGYVQTFEYDNQNRITKTTYYHNGTDYAFYTFEYNGDDLVKYVGQSPSGGQYTVDYSKSGNVINVIETDSEGRSHVGTIELNSDGYPVAMSFEGSSYQETYQYFDGNMVKYSHGEGGSSSLTFQYDDKKSPFYNCKTPKWFFITRQFFESYFTPIKNNATKMTAIYNDYTEECEISYEYDDAGFATKMTYKGGDNFVFTFSY